MFILYGRKTKSTLKEVLKEAKRLVAHPFVVSNDSSHPTGKSVTACPVCSCRSILLRVITMKVDPPLWPQVPVAAHWQQSGRGAKKLPDDWLPLPQVDDNATTEEPRREQRLMSVEETTKKTTTRTTEETTKKKTRARVSM